MVKEYVEAATNEHQPDEQESERYSRFIPWFETALIVLGLLANFFLLSHDNGYDGWDRFVALGTMLTQGKIPDIKYSMVGPIFSTPFYYLGNISQTPWWYPFVVHQPLDQGQVLYLLYSFLVGAYLLVPLLIRTQRQLIAAVLEFGRTRLALRSWRI